MIRNAGKSPKICPLIITAVRIIYIVLLIYVCIGHSLINRNLYYQTADTYLFNVVPFKTIVKYINIIYNNEINIDTVILLIVKNYVMTIPMRFIIGDKLNNEKKCLLLAGAIFLSFEVAQTLLKIGIFDIDDIILNIVGYFTGLFVFKMLKLDRKEKSHEK